MLAAPQFQCFILAADLVKQPFGTFHIHDDVFHAVRNQRRAGDVARYSLEVEILKTLARVGVIVGSDDPLHLLADGRVPFVKFFQHVVAGTPQDQRLDARFERDAARRVVSRHADTDAAHPVGIDFRPLREVVDCGFERHFVIRPRDDSLEPQT